jgi:anthranilate phosphoribosyltransferase
MKGESIDEIVGAAKAIREKSIKIPIDNSLTIVDTCGTGGDGSNTFNISTVSAIVAAGGGVRVAKHGNKSVSSSCGSADVLKELGVNVEANINTIKECILKCNIGFLFAPALHLAMKYAMGPRQDMAIRTIFNSLGPLTNPAGANHHLIGVYDSSLLVPIAGALKKMGSKRAVVAHGEDGLDEVTTTTITNVAELIDGKIKTYIINPKDYGINYCNITDITGSDPKHNAEIVKNILAGKKDAKRDIVLLNTGVTFYISGCSPSIKDGIGKAEETIDSGKARKTLDKLIELSNI